MSSDDLQHVPGRLSHQVLFMDQNEIEHRSQSNHSMSYYQVATPKSPHELSSSAEDDDRERHVLHGDEDNEHLRFIAAKREILDQINLTIMQTHKEMENIIAESDRISGQVEALQILHEDPNLLQKIENYQVERAEELEKAILSKNETTKQGNKNYFYHTRSKANSHVSGLKLADDKIIAMRLKGTKTIGKDTKVVSEVGPEASTRKFPQHHTGRNFSSTCATSNSGIIGKTDDGKPIFRRPDGILIIITCSRCGREGFTSAQGVVNHMRLKHSLHYHSQPLAVLSNQVLLADDKQHAFIMDKFKELGLSPEKDYLPSTIPVASGEKRNSLKENSHSNPHITTRQGTLSTKHLEKMYGEDDFKEIVEYVKEADKDLDTLLKYESSQSPEILLEDEPKTRPKKRTAKGDRHRPAEKKARPDVVHTVEHNVPEEEKRSRHYNLRAKSKLKSLHRSD